jgi:cell wall integrity and stress response component
MHPVAMLSVAGLALFLIPTAAKADDVSYYGCYSSDGSLKKMDSSVFQSSGYCRVNCTETNDGYSVQAMTKGEDCLCGNSIPWNGFKVDDNKCDDKCGGFPMDTCM